MNRLALNIPLQKRFTRRAISCSVAVFTCFLLATTVFADDPLCWNYSNMTPVIDGVVSTDANWQKANQFVFGNGTTQPDAKVQMQWDLSSKMYLSFTVNHDDHYNSADKIVILLGPDPNDETKDWRIHLHPVSNSGNTGGAPFKIDVWRDSTTWASNAQFPTQVNPPWIKARVVTVDGPADTVNPAFGTKDNSYTVELSFDVANSLAATNGIYAVGGGSMKLHLNVLRVYKVLSSGVELTRVAGQLNWPENASIPGVPSNPTQSQLFGSPARSKWGSALMGGSGTASCSGVQVSQHWINSQPNTSVLSPPAPGASSVTNNYFVELLNTGTAPAEKILASIKKGTFGISPIPAFSNIPASPNPLGPSGTILPGATTILGPAAWTISAADYQSNYAPTSQEPNKNYVCSYVQLDVDPSASGRVLIANRYSYWNTHYGSASTFTNTALFDTKGFEAPADGSGIQRFDLKVFPKEVLPINRSGVKTNDLNRTVGVLQMADKTTLEELNQINALGMYKEGARFYRKIVCGYRHTGKYIQMDGTNMELMENTPCYSYWLKHFGEISNWSDGLSGNGLERISDLAYTVAIPHGQLVSLNTRIEAVEPIIPPVCRPTPCTPCPPKTAGSSLLIGMIGIGGAAGISLKPRRRKEENEQDTEK